MSYIIKESDTPKDIANLVFVLAEDERQEVIEENARRAEKLQEPLPVPSWDLNKMLKNIEIIINKRFSNPRYGELNPWDGKRSAEDWKQISTKFLRDSYLLKVAKNDPELFKQMCEKWPEITPDPDLTKEQRAELAKLQLQADNIIARGEELVSEFMKLAEQEINIIKNTQSKFDALIREQTRYLKVDTQYYKGFVRKWR